MLKRLRAKRSSAVKVQPLIEEVTTSYFESSAPTKLTRTTSGAQDSAELTLSRMVTGDSVFSTYNPQALISRTRAKSQDRRLDPLGLSVVHEPDGPPSADVVFVHGLGGTSRQTWSKDRNAELFWPEKWLKFEPDIQTARILSFGYNANFSESGTGSISRISDFAKDLLYQLRLGNNEGVELEIGTRPLIFVVHSMGGLVVKKAYIMGQQDEQYKPVIDAVKSIVFLSTPHRGTDLANTLNRILSVSIFNHSPKEYVAELAKSSPALAELNEQFRHIAPKLQIFSFYETLQTPLGPKKVMILERESSILGYPGEISKPLEADHHHVCKYSSTEDSNYKSVRDALKSLISKCLRVVNHRRVEDDSEDLLRITSLLNVAEKPSDDFTWFRDQWRSGTCDWVTDDPYFQSWLREADGARILWINALPASGKSILTTYIINLLEETDRAVSYYYFRFNDQAKRSLANCLRSIAFQTAAQVPEFRKALIKMGTAGIKMEKLDGRTMWKRVFVDLLFKIPLQSTVYWVIDALDEADAPRSLIELLGNVSSAKMPIKVLLVSRDSSELRLAFQRLARTTLLDTISIGGDNKDIEFYVEQEIEYLYALDAEQKKELTAKLLAKATGNFLWVTLALNEILGCVSPEEIEETLKGIPMGMEEIYIRMEATIVKSMDRRPTHKALARKILSWTTCGRRPLQIKELAEALQPELSILDLKHTITETCGHFVVVDQQSTKVSMVHETAAYFLTHTTGLELSISPQKAHEELFAKCISFISDQPHRRPSGHIDTRAFMQYATTSWAYHLRSSPPQSNAVLNILVKFLKSQFVLVWIASLAQFGQLKELVYASKTLTKYVSQRRKHDATISPLLHRITDLEVVESWAMDMNKIVGKFTNVLLDDPSTIYKFIPPFCAKDSRIFKQFGEKDFSPSSLTIDGITSHAWDDNLAKILVSQGSRAMSIVCSGQRFAVLTSAGKIVLYDATTFEEVRTIQHGEFVLAMSFNHGTDKMVSYGFKTTKIWDVNTGKLLFEVPCPPDSRAIAVAFTVDDSRVMIGSNDRSIRSLSLADVDAGWKTIGEDEELLREASSSDRAYHSAPSCIAFNPEVNQVAVAYRSFPLTVWSLDPPEIVGRCIRNRATKSWTWVDRIIWHPTSGEVLGRYMDGSVFKWHPSEGTHQEINAAASQIACSPEGTLFATSDGDGRLKVYNFHHFTLIYQLSTPGFSSHLAFSPDCRRIYDLRGQFCNVWEPNSLIRLTDVEDHDSERGSEMGSAVATSVFSDVWAETRDSVTSIAVQPRKNLYAVGNESGLVQVFQGGNPVSIIWESQIGMTAVHLDWAEDGEHVAIFELGGKVLVKRIVPPKVTERNPGAMDTVLDLKVKVEIGGIQQILLSSTSKYLLVSSRTSVETHCVETKTHLGTKILLISTSPIRWMNHPSNPDWVLSFEIDCVTIYCWADLTEVDVYTFADSAPIPGIAQRPSASKILSSGSIETSDLIRRNIKRLFSSPTGEHIIFQHSRASPNQRRQQETVILESAAFTPTIEPSHRQQLVPLPIPEEIQLQIEIPLCVLGKHRFVFLDKRYWMCTWHLDGNGPGDGKTVQRHFFLPRDWLNMDCLALCTMLGDGTLLVPKNGEVAAIGSGVTSQW